MDQVVSLLMNQHIVAIPTETVYGLAGDACSDEACLAIYRIKKRAPDNPLISHFAHIDQLANYDIKLSSIAKELFNKFSPGPITLVLAGSRGISLYAKAHLSTVAVRIPSHTLTRRLLEAIDKPLVAPSANRSGRYSATTAAMVYDQLSGEIPAILDGGTTDLGLESTVVHVHENMATIVRFGSITYQQLQEVLGASHVSIAPALQHNNTCDYPILSPGMKYAHYQPRYPLILFTEIANVHALNHKKNIVLLILQLHKNDVVESDFLKVISFVDAVDYAKYFYASLSQADFLTPLSIIAYYNESLGDALCDRLKRSANYSFL